MAFRGTRFASLPLEAISRYPRGDSAVTPMRSLLARGLIKEEVKPWRSSRQPETRM